MVDRSARISVVLLACAAIVGCQKNAASSKAPDAAGASSRVDDPLAQPEQALSANADELRSLGVVLDDGDKDDKDNEEDAGAAEPPPVADERREATKSEAPASTRCAAICQLADTACELRTQICDLAQDHVGESRYEAACWRATDQCTRASSACEDCRGTTAGTSDGC